MLCVFLKASVTIDFCSLVVLAVLVFADKTKAITISYKKKSVFAEQTNHKKRIPLGILLGLLRGLESDKLLKSFSHVSIYR